MTTAFGQFNAAPCKIKIKSNGDFIGSVITTRERERAKMNASVIEIARTLKCVRHIRCEQRVILLENLLPSFVGSSPSFNQSYPTK